MKKRAKTANRIKNLLSFLPPYVLTGISVLAILWLTLSPRPFGDLHAPLFPGADKIAHALMFGFLVAMMSLDRMRRSDYHPLSPIFLFSAAVLSSSLGITIEYLQEMLHAGRSFEYPDMIADCAGAFAVALLWLIFQPKSEE